MLWLPSARGLCSRIPLDETHLKEDPTIKDSVREVMIVTIRIISLVK